MESTALPTRFSSTLVLLGGFVVTYLNANKAEHLQPEHLEEREVFDVDTQDNDE
jgi:hypothetical protein